MPSKAAIRAAVRRLTGLYVYRTPPRGTDFRADLRTALPGFDPVLVFDVGANIGQSTAEYLAAFPRCRVHAFEPLAATAAQLARRFGGDRRVTLSQVALSDRDGEARMEIAERSVAARLSETGALVTTETIDSYRARAGIDRIGFLKVDTEGHDLAVLQGAMATLAAKAIDMIQVEAGMSPDNLLHAKFEDMKTLLEAHGYRLFGLYEQTREFPSDRQFLRRANAVFILPERLGG